jgi:FAD/FMN-containing dehydrogenase
LVFGRPLVHLITTIAKDVDQREPTRPGQIDDASRLNATGVHRVVRIGIDDVNPESQLVELLRQAQTEGRRVSIAGARHSMGGHTIYPGGIVLDMSPMNAMHLNPDTDLLHVQAGATWHEVIDYLRPLGRSPAIMQSNDSFSVGGSLSVNCHGWQFNSPPIASSVDSFRLLQADGTIVRCSRDAHADLFSLALGGYGLFGVILDAELRVVPDATYRLEQHVVPLNESMAIFDSRVDGRPEVEMAFARMNIVPETFLDDVIINVFTLDPDAPSPPVPDTDRSTLLDTLLRGSSRAVFRGSAESDYGKELRWDAETKVAPLLEGSVFTRNQLLDEGVEVLENRLAETTDILHEYFVPRDQAWAFVQSMRRIVRQHDGNLLNVTIRSVNEDTDTVLRFAREPVFAFVMLFLQDRTASGEAHMAAMTQDLIDASIEHGGTYYLPYRLHATLEQFHRAYPQAVEFLNAKRQLDPEELFQNQFYVKYALEQADP